jgi:CHAT domain-containing protein/tetratricopeptide (TPR) repeat protein
MRSFVRAGSAAIAIAILLLGGLSISRAQQTNDVDQLIDQFNELTKARKDKEAVPLVQQILATRERQYGPNHRVVAIWLNNLCFLYDNLGRYAEAEPLLKRALAIEEKSLGREHTEVATTLRNLSNAYWKLGRYAEAEPLAQRSLAIREKTLGPDHLDVSDVLNVLTLIYTGQGRYSEALPIGQRLLAIREKALGRDHPAVAAALNNLASVYSDQGRYGEAERLHKRALTIREKALGSEHPDLAFSLNNLAEVYERQGRYVEAAPMLERSLSIREKALGRDHPYVAHALNNLAMLYSRLGRYAAAEPLHQRAVTIQEKVLGPGHPELAESLSSLALLYATQGRYAEAEPLAQRSLAIREKTLGRDHPDVAQSLNGLAELYGRQGRYTDAEPLSRRSLAVHEKTLGPDHPDVAKALNNLALLLYNDDRYADAEPLYERALTIWEKALGRDHSEVATALNNLALVYSAEDRYDDAEPLYRRSLAIREKTLGPDHPHVAQLLNNLASLYDDQGRYAEAEPLYQRALASLERTLGRDHPDVAAVRNGLALLYKHQARYADALPIVRENLSHGTAKRNAAFPVLFAAQAQNILDAPQALAESYEMVQRVSASAAGSAVSKLAARFAAGSTELAILVRRDQDLTVEAESLDKAVVAFVAKPPSERSATGEEQIRKRIESVKAERANLQQIFDARFADYVALSRPQPISISETQGLLAEDEALLIFDFASNSYGWIVTKDDADWTQLGVSAKDLDAAVRKLRLWLTDPRQKFDPELSYQIYQATFGTFGEKIASKKRLSIVTNGALTSLPPQLLIIADPSGKSLKEMDWLIRSHAVTILPSVASLKVLRGGSQNSSARKPMIAFADPVFSKAARARAQVAMRSITSFYRGTQIDLAGIGEYLPQLPGTRSEAQQLAAELKADPTDIKLGLAASETAVKQAKLDQYRIVYFATHGLVAGDLESFAKDKAEPALVLSIPEKPSDLDDGLLTAGEIAQLKLDADWVVLSACNTAAEEKPGAEALSGLARAFFYAGARSLIVSHWSVDDVATARLMVGTLRASARDPSLSHAEALRVSMLAMIDAAKSDAEADPRLWAPFVVVGEPAKPR